MSTYTYYGFGLNIQSEIPFPELSPVPSFEQAHVNIRLGKVPAVPDGCSFSTGRISYVMNDSELLITVPDTGRYYVSGGHTIIMHPDYEDCEMRMLRLFVLAAGMAGILQQRGIIPMHTGSVLIDGKLTLIAGRSGAGKSTTLAGLLNKQYRIFSDDIVVLAEGAGSAMHGIASYPMIKLWEQSMQALAYEDRSFPIMPGMEKYGLFFHDDFDPHQYPINRVILLKLSENNGFTTERLSGGNAFEAVVEHIYKPSFFNSSKMRVLKFKTITQLLQNVDVYQIARPVNCAPDDLLSHVISLL
ncbi:hypothetical protein [Chitinophaga sancti]|uniref:HPr Serine kinase C-terminal domain-containing protein n=1 Tax=Chitinophaga sancti TaxID=1004 RepID=A0A1K1M7K8_9BACT|nr:hypothetical protein [Chitinophaga sancti]WQD64580.1 hypothetical protein U0033_09250 [Chitinophaga sancti]WQG89796.1 hypothetical protein SR876_33225 [Chitinophaga sancti]SFW19057.1 hypothetical protein SAMN05661012_00503 [Chitinophaga sancti]